MTTINCYYIPAPLKLLARSSNSKIDTLLLYTRNTPFIVNAKFSQILLAVHILVAGPPHLKIILCCTDDDEDLLLLHHVLPIPIFLQMNLTATSVAAAIFAHPAIKFRIFWQGSKGRCDVRVG